MRLITKSAKIVREVFAKLRLPKQTTSKQKLLMMIAFTWAIIGVMLYVLAAQKAIDSTASQNAARASTLVADIHRLPSFSDVTIGQTSGLLPHIKSTRDEMAKSIEGGVYRPVSPPIWTAFHPSYWSGASARKLHTSQIDQLRQLLLDTVDHIDKFGRFIAYSPAIDLGETLDMPDAAERLERTEAGFREVRSALPGSDLPERKKSLSILIEIMPQISTMTSDKLPEWSKKVAQVQQTILDDMQQQDSKNAGYAPKLLDAVLLYQ